MAKFNAGDRVRGTGAIREEIRGKQGTIVDGQMAFEPTYDVQFDGIEELERLVREPWLEPAFSRCS